MCRNRQGRVRLVDLRDRASDDQPFKVLVCGSRNWEDRATIKDALDGVALKHGPLHVIHGDCRGADRVAAARAEYLGFQVTAFPADWSVKPDTPPGRVRQRYDGYRYDVAAGRERNLAMLDQDPDLVLAFQTGRSTGTQHTIDEARKRGIPVHVVTDKRPLEGKR